MHQNLYIYDIIFSKRVLMQTSIIRAKFGRRLIETVGILDRGYYRKISFTTI